jgi:hypothetical protein
VETLVIDSQTRPESILSFMGGVKRLLAVKQGPSSALLTPAAGADEFDEPEVYDIDPDDYPDTTAYLNAIPGAVERLLAYRDLPDSEFEEWK